MIEQAKLNSLFFYFRTDGATFIGKLHHDLSSAQKCLPPGVKVLFELERSTDKFYLMTNDSEEYKTKLTHCVLYVPVGKYLLV